MISTSHSTSKLTARCDGAEIARSGLLCFAVFLILYNISFISSESLSTGRLAVFIIGIWYLFFANSIDVKFDWRILLIFFPFPYVIAQFAFDRDSGQISRFLHLALYSYTGGFLVAVLSRGVDEVLRAFLVAIAIQSVILAVSFFSSEYRAWVDETVVTGANYSAAYLYRAPGLSSSGGSALSVIQSLGVLAGGLLLSRATPARGFSNKNVIIFLMMVCALSCLIVGRTGVVLSLLFFLLLLPFSGHVFRVIKILIIALMAVAFPAQFLLDNILATDFSSEYFLGWAFGFFVGEDLTVSTLSSMTIKELGVDTLFGSGLVSLIDGSNPSGHDSGFVQNYFSMGFVMMVILYVIYIFILYTILRWMPLYLRIGLVAIFILIEVKEPYLFKYSIMFFLLSLYFSSCRTPRPAK